MHFSESSNVPEILRFCNRLHTAIIKFQESSECLKITSGSLVYLEIDIRDNTLDEILLDIPRVKTLKITSRNIDILPTDVQSVESLDWVIFDHKIEMGDRWSASIYVQWVEKCTKLQSLRVIAEPITSYSLRPILLQLYIVGHLKHLKHLKSLELQSVHAVLFRELLDANLLQRLSLDGCSFYLGASAIQTILSFRYCGAAGLLPTVKDKWLQFIECNHQD
jgi:hypothetical protein